MDLVVLWVVMVLVLVVTVFIGSIAVAAQKPDFAYRAVSRTKAGTVIMIIITGAIGGIYFLLRVRPQLTAAERAMPPESSSRRHPGDIKQWRRDHDPWS